MPSRSTEAAGRGILDCSDEMAVRVHEAVAEIEDSTDLTALVGRAQSAEVWHLVDDVELRIAAKVAFLSPTGICDAKME